MLDIENTNRIGTRFWSSISKCIPMVIEDSQWKMRVGSSSFWFDKWLEGDPLCAQVPQVVEPKLKINEICLESGWDMVRMRDLVGDNLASQVIAQVANRRKGTDLLIWMPQKHRLFTVKTTWKVVRIRGEHVQTIYRGRFLYQWVYIRRQDNFGGKE